jgi:hypothetical protein
VEEVLVVSSDLQIVVRVGFKRFEARSKMSIRVLEDAEAIFSSLCEMKWRVLCGGKVCEDAIYTIYTIATIMEILWYI